ncbi:hypothetical protein FKP32DRAFT_1671921 [Trametes sanguinea]|nr:hypothetical protein FKP32DRAFT_1680471 [Trametes sanguinea]KAI9068791.1 hypothetical protein FKP32DRAFT_1671921 [Trametes sanguinea]
MPAATRVPTHFAVLAMLASADDLATLIEVAIPTATDHAVHTIFLFEELADSGNRDPRDWRDSMDRVISALSVLLGLDRDLTLLDHLVDRAERVFNCSDLDPRLVERFRARLARAVLEVRRLSNEANASRLAMFDHIAMNLRVAFRRSPPSEHHSARLRLVCADLDNVREVVRQERDGIQELAASTSDMEAYAGTLRALTADADDVDTNDNW